MKSEVRSYPENTLVFMPQVYGVKITRVLPREICRSALGLLRRVMRKVSLMIARSQQRPWLLVALSSEGSTNGMDTGQTQSRVEGRRQDA